MKNSDMMMLVMLLLGLSLSVCVTTRAVADADDGGTTAPLPEGRELYWGDEPVEVLSDVRGRQVLNGLWRFVPATDGASEPRGQWGWIPVPGSWRSQNFFKVPTAAVVGHGPEWQENLNQTERVWYERQIVVPEAWVGRHVLLQLDRVATGAEVYLDGQQAGQVAWPYGEVDLTPLATPGRQQTLRVLVTSASDGGQIVEATDFDNIIRRGRRVEARGLLGDVWLASRPQGAHVDGVFIKPSVRQRELGVAVDLADVGEAGPVRFTAIIKDQEGEEVRRFSTEKRVDAASAQTLDLTWSWPDPKLWDYQQPNLYTLLLEVEGAGLNDTFAERFGFREFWIEGRDIYLNGKPFRFRPITEHNKTRQLGSSRRIAEAVIQQYLRDNFNVLEIWPHNLEYPGTLNMRPLWARVADEQGLPVLMPLVTQAPLLFNNWDEPAMRREWEQRTIAEWKRVRNHPSVIGFVLTPNRFSYYDDQSPVRIGNSETGRNPANFWLPRERMGLEAIEFVKSIDGTRAVTHHSAATVGDFYTVNMYLNYIPLQEREEWLSAWAESGDMPFLAVEMGLPLFFTGLRGRAHFHDAKGTEPLLTEGAATYLGSEAYALESDTYRQAIAAHHIEDQAYHNVWFHHALEPAWVKLQVLFIRNTWRSWRTYGHTGGMIPWAYAGDYGLWWKGPRTRVSFEPGELGYHFDEVPTALLEGRHAAWDQLRPRMEALSEGSSPSMAYIAGEPDAFVAKDHHFYGDSTVEKQAVLINDHRAPHAFEYQWQVEVASEVIASGREDGSIDIGENHLMPIHFSLPAVNEKTDGRIRLTAKIGPDEHEDVFTFRIFAPLEKTDHRILIHDPAGDTSKLLAALGYQLESWQGGTAADRVLVIGRDALGRDEPLPGDLESFVNGGGRVVLFSQSLETLRRLGFRAAGNVGRRFFIAQADHPIVAGLDEHDLRDWRGAGTLLPETRHISTGESHDRVIEAWRWGNRGSVSSVAVEKPHHSGWTPVIEGEWDLAFSPLMELHRGAGMILLNTLDLEGRQELDPVAELLTRRILTYAASAEVAERQSATYLGDDQGAAVLDAMGLLHRRADRLPDIPGLVVLGEGARITDEQLRGFIDQGGRVFGLPRDAAMPLGYRTQQRTYSRSLTVPDWPEARGLSPSDLRVRTDVEASLITTGPGDIAAEGLLARVQLGQGVAVFMQLSAQHLDTEAKPYLRYSSWRLTRAMSQLLANLGGEFEADAALLTLKASAEQQDYYVPGYIEDFTLGDDPYRYWRW